MAVSAQPLELRIEHILGGRAFILVHTDKNDNNNCSAHTSKLVTDGASISLYLLLEIK